MTLDNGCMCCTVRGDLVRALTELDKRAQDKGQRLDAVLIETTGLADPAPVAFTFFANQYINTFFRIDAILCLVDAKHIREHLLEKKPDDAVNEAVQQIAFADRIILNKLDLVTDEEKEEVLDMIRSVNAAAEIMETQARASEVSHPGPRSYWPQHIPQPGVPALIAPTGPLSFPQHSKVPLKHILGVNSFSVEKTLEIDPDFLASEDEHDHECNDPTCTHEHHHHHHDHDHDHEVGTHCPCCSVGHWPGPSWADPGRLLTSPAVPRQGLQGSQPPSPRPRAPRPRAPRP